MLVLVILEGVIWILIGFFKILFVSFLIGFGIVVEKSKICVLLGR